MMDLFKKKRFTINGNEDEIAKAREFSSQHNIDADVAVRDNRYVFFNKGNTLLRQEHYEPHVRKALARLVRLWIVRNPNRQLNYIDIGANIGLHCLYIYSLFDSAIIHAFDASPQSYNYLEITKEYNAMDRLTIYKNGLGENNEMVNFFNWGEESSADSLFNTMRVEGVPNIIKVQIKRLDDVLLPNGILPSVIKMDTEGCEMLILNGAEKVIRGSRPYILLEIHPENIKAAGVQPADFLRWGGEHQYSLYAYNGKKTGSIKILNQQLNHEIYDYILMPNEVSL